MSGDALREFLQKGVKRYEPMPLPPRALAVEIRGNTIAVVVSDEPLCPFRDYPVRPSPAAGVARVGQNMGDPEHPERYHAGAGDTVPLGRVVEQEGRRFRKCGRAAFGGLVVGWYESV
jgi:hypothetical protein